MKSFDQFLIETNSVGVVAVYPGRFQPVHLGHKKVYDFLVKELGVAYVCTSGKVEEKSPLSFEEKKYLLELIRIPSNRIVLENTPYQPKNLFTKLSKTPDKVSLVFGVGKKDMEEDPRFAFKLKKNGEQPYYQPYTNKPLDVAEKHGYVITVPTMQFKVLGKNIKSASEIRKMFGSASEENRKQIVIDLYGKFDKKAYDILVSKLS